MMRSVGQIVQAAPMATWMGNVGKVPVALLAMGTGGNLGGNCGQEPSGGTDGHRDEQRRPDLRGGADGHRDMQRRKEPPGGAGCHQDGQRRREWLYLEARRQRRQSSGRMPIETVAVVRQGRPGCSGGGTARNGFA